MCARVGARDVTVHPWHSRRLVRLVRELYARAPHPRASAERLVRYAEPRDKEHWWWDTLCAFLSCLTSHSSLLSSFFFLYSLSFTSRTPNDGGVAHDPYVRDFVAELLPALERLLRAPLRAEDASCPLEAYAYTCSH